MKASRTIDMLLRSVRMLLEGTGLFRSFFFFQAEDGIRDPLVTGVQTCALPISARPARRVAGAAGRDSDAGGDAQPEPSRRGGDRGLRRARDPPSAGGIKEWGWNGLSGQTR